MRRAHPQRVVSDRTQGGFTLLEMMVSMALLGILMAMAYGGLRAGIRAAASGEAAIERTNQIRVAQQFLRGQLSRALPLVIVDDPDAEGEEDVTEQVVFEGEKDFMRFVAPMPGYLGFGGPHIQVLAVRNGDNGKELIFAHDLLNVFEREDPLENDRREPIVLLDGIQDAEFLYRTFDEDGEVGEWDSEWEDAGSSPLMVKIDLEMTQESKLIWPDLEVPLVIESTSRQRRAASQRNKQPQPVPEESQ